MTLHAEWLDGLTEPTHPPDPRYPRGIDIDASDGAEPACDLQLDYPAKRCGGWLIRCDRCAKTAYLTAAGRADDPRSFRMACGASQSSAPRSGTTDKPESDAGPRPAKPERQ